MINNPLPLGVTYLLHQNTDKNSLGKLEIHWLLLMTGTMTYSNHIASYLVSERNVKTEDLLYMYAT